MKCSSLKNLLVLFVSILLLSPKDTILSADAKHDSLDSISKKEDVLNKNDNSKVVTRSIPSLKTTSKRSLKKKNKKSKSAKFPKSSKFSPIPSLHPTAQPSSQPSSQPSDKKVVTIDVCPISTVTADVYRVSGSTTVVTASETNETYTGPSIQCALDAKFEWDSLFKAANDDGQLDSYIECSFPTFLEPNDNWDPPIYFINDGSEADFQIVTATDEGIDPSPGSLNDSMYKGGVNCEDTSCGSNKVIIKFQDFTLDDLWNVTINQIEYIEYDFYPISCPTASSTDTCPGQFYISIYTHMTNNGYPLVNENWYNCRYGFTPTSTSLKVGEGMINEWSTFRIEATDTATSIASKGSPPDCDTTTALEDVDDANLLGSNYLEPTIFILNMGQSDETDNGLAGYFDNIRIKLLGEDAVRIYDL